MTCLKKYQSSEEAVEDHKKNYNSRGDAKGKYKPDAPDAKRIKYIRDQIPDGSTVLDIGCNDGGLGVLLQKRGCVVFGVDCVKQLVKISVAKGLLAHVGEAENLPFDDEKFERVVLAEVLEHLFDPLKGLGRSIGSYSLKECSLVLCLIMWVIWAKERKQTTIIGYSAKMTLESF